MVQETPKEVVSFELDLVDELSCFLRFFSSCVHGSNPCDTQSSAGQVQQGQGPPVSLWRHPGDHVILGVKLGLFLPVLIPSLSPSQEASGGRQGIQRVQKHGGLLKGGGGQGSGQVEPGKQQGRCGCRRKLAMVSGRRGSRSGQTGLVTHSAFLGQVTLFISKMEIIVLS